MEVSASSWGRKLESNQIRPPRQAALGREEAFEKPLTPPVQQAQKTVFPSGRRRQGGGDLSFPVIGKFVTKSPLRPARSRSGARSTKKSQHQSGALIISLCAQPAQQDRGRCPVTVQPGCLGIAKYSASWCENPGRTVCRPRNVAGPRRRGDRRKAKRKVAMLAPLVRRELSQEQREIMCVTPTVDRTERRHKARSSMKWRRLS